MVSIIITAKEEARTIGRAILAFLKQDYGSNDFEIIVVAPDKETLAAAKCAYGEVKTIQDENMGKPAALNLAIKEAKGETLVFSDGDVEVAGSAVKELLSCREDLVSGRPIIWAEKDDLYGFWQKILFDMAHRLRIKKSGQGQYFPVSGYLFLIKKEMLNNFTFPEGLLAEDEYLSYYVWSQGGKIGYQPKAEVSVRGPRNFSDWVKQKTRTVGAGFQAPKKWKKRTGGRSFWFEAREAWVMWRDYGDSFRRTVWLWFLFLARFYVWLLVLVKIRLLGQSRAKIWQRVESTK